MYMPPLESITNGCIGWSPLSGRLSTITSGAAVGVMLPGASAYSRILSFDSAYSAPPYSAIPVPPWPPLSTLSPNRAMTSATPVAGRVAQRHQEATRVRLVLAVVLATPRVHVDRSVGRDHEVPRMPDAVGKDGGAEPGRQRQPAVVGRARERSPSAKPSCCPPSRLRPRHHCLRARHPPSRAPAASTRLSPMSLREERILNCLSRAGGLASSGPITCAAWPGFHLPSSMMNSDSRCSIVCMLLHTVPSNRACVPHQLIGNLLDRRPRTGRDRPRRGLSAALVGYAIVLDMGQVRCLLTRGVILTRDTQG